MRREQKISGEGERLTAKSNRSAVHSVQELGEIAGNLPTIVARNLCQPILSEIGCKGLGVVLLWP